MGRASRHSIIRHLLMSLFQSEWQMGVMALLASLSPEACQTILK